jgi:hypothetical protein
MTSMQHQLQWPVPEAGSKEHVLSCAVCLWQHHPFKGLTQQMLCTTALTILYCAVTSAVFLTQNEDFSAADAVHDCIGEAGEERFSLADLSKLLEVNTAA